MVIKEPLNSVLRNSLNQRIDSISKWFVGSSSKIKSGFLRRRYARSNFRFCPPESRLTFLFPSSFSSLISLKILFFVNNSFSLLFDKR